MTKHTGFKNYHECYEYHGNTTIERIKKQFGRIVSRDWIIFNTVEEAREYFDAVNTELGECYA